MLNVSFCWLGVVESLSARLARPRVSLARSYGKSVVVGEWVPAEMLNGRVRSCKSTFLTVSEYFFPLPNPPANGCIVHTQVLCDLSLSISTISVCLMDGFDALPGGEYSVQGRSIGESLHLRYFT